MPKLKFTTKQNVAKPVEVDEVRLVSANIEFRDGTAEFTVALFDDGNKVGEQPIQIGLGMPGDTEGPRKDLNLDKVESDIMRLVQKCGVLPLGGTVEED